MITCPQSNLKLASGIVPVQRGCSITSICVGIGTDGCAFNNSLDLFREMDMLADSRKPRHGMPNLMAAEMCWPVPPSPEPSALGLADTGTITPGANADLLIINTRYAPP